MCIRDRDIYTETLIFNQDIYRETLIFNQDIYTETLIFNQDIYREILSSLDCLIVSILINIAKNP